MFILVDELLGLLLGLEYNMIQITTRIREGRTNKKGETRILLVLFEGKKTKELSTGISVNPQYWDQKKRRVKNSEGSQVKNSKLAKMTNEIQDLINNESLLTPNTTVAQIVTAFKDKGNSQDPLFVDYISKYIEANPEDLSPGTLIYHNTCRERVKDYRPYIKLSQIDETFLIAFEKHLKVAHENKPNTIFNRMKVIRKMLRRANREGIISTNPFQFYSIKTEKSEREYLTIDEIFLLKKVKKLTKLQELVRDIYLFCAMVCGLRFGDIATLTTANLVNKTDGLHLSAVMSKTKKRVTFKLTALGLKLIEKYKGQGVGTYLFPILKEIATPENHRRIVSARNAYFNKEIKKIGKKAGIEKHLTMHTARHTFATIALGEGISTEVVGELLGHSDLKTTQIYTKILDRSKEDAMNKMDQLLN